MTVRSTLRLLAAQALARTAVAVCVLMGATAAMVSSVALADETTNSAAISAARAVSAATQYTVKPGQSLNDIAIAATQSHDPAVLARTAKVIFDTNPSAFMRGNSSRMKVGAVLNVPPLDPSGAVTHAAPVASVASASAPSGGAAGIGAVVAATGSAVHSASSVTAAVAAPVSGAAHAVAPAAQDVGASSTVAASGAVQTAPHLQAGVAAPTSDASGGHAWTGSIQAAASEPVQAAASDANGTVATGLPSVSSAASAAAAPVVGAASAATAAPVAGASASGAPPHARLSSLQQLLALKNHVLMDLQRHGFGAQAPHAAAGNTSRAASATSAATMARPGSAPQAALPRAAAHEPMVGHSMADERFIGVGGYGFHVSRASVPMVAAIASAAVAALLVLIVGFAVAGRKRRAAPSGAQEEAEQPETRDEPRLADADAPTQDPLEAQFLEMLAHTPTSKRALMGLAELYAERSNGSAFNEIAAQIRSLSGGRGPNWLHVASLGRQVDPDNPLYALSDEGAEEVNTPADEGDGALPVQSAAAQQHADGGVPEPAPDTEEPSLPMPSAPVEGASANPPAGKAPDTEFPADAVDALNELDMPLPPRVEGQVRPHEAGVAPEHAATPSDAAHAAPHDASHEAQASMDSSERNAARAREADAQHVDDTARGDLSAPAAVAGLGAARFGALNLAFDLDLPNVANGTPVMMATPAQPMFSPEEIAKIARNKIELAAEYIALGDFGGARTLIHEVIESNDPGTRDEARALLATLAPLS
jgi:pilus assembly protein FimV